MSAAVNYQGGWFPFDLPPQSLRQGVGSNSFLTQQRRASRRSLGLRIARKRLLQFGSTDTKNEKNLPSSPPLLFRRGDDDDDESGDDFSLTTTAYQNIAFLNDETVIAADELGQIDAIRLPRYAHPNENRWNGEESKGKLLASRMGQPLRREHKKPRAVLKSFKNGEAFAMGLSHGEMRIFATNHESTWRQPDSETQRGAVRNEVSYQNDTYLNYIMRKGGARRRYRRNLQLSLIEMLSNNMGMSCNRFDLSEFSDWENGNFPPERDLISVTEKSFRRDAIWDFRESGSTILAAHVDQERDCFSLQVIDGRSKHQNSGSGLRRDASQAIYVDKMMTGAWKKHKEDITGICFVAEHGIATAHVCSTIGSHISCHRQNVLKFWDKRKIQNEPVAESCILSFPFNDVRSVSTSHEKTFIFNEDLSDPSFQIGSANEWAILSDKDKSTSDLTSMRIQRISASSEHSGTISISMRSNVNSVNPDLLHQPCSELLIDKNGHDLLHTMRYFACKTPTHEGIHTTWNANHDFLACVGAQHKPDGGNEQNLLDESSLLLFDVSRHQECSVKSMYNGIEGNPKTKKRSHDEMNKSQSEDECSDLAAKLPVHLTDRYGIESSLTCIAMNDLGTAIVCGSGDGDLFMWRGG